MLLQSEEPLVHRIQDSVTRLGKTLANRIIKSNIMKESALTSIDFEDKAIFVPVQSIHLGGMTKINPPKLLNDGDIEDIFVAARAYFKAAISYIHK